MLRPIVADEERRAGAHLVRTGGALRARDQVGLRALNDALKNAFDTPGTAAFESGGQPLSGAARDGIGERRRDSRSAGPTPGTASRRSRRRRCASGRRSCGFTPSSGAASRCSSTRIGSRPAHQCTSPSTRVWGSTCGATPFRSPTAAAGRASTRICAAACPPSPVAVSAYSPRPVATRRSWSCWWCATTPRGWVREIARKDEDAEIEAHFDPETGIVTVYEGRREFKALERAARRSGLSKARVREYLPYRMLEVEVAANTLYAWAAEEILARRLAEERPADPARYAAAVRREAQALRYRAHDKLMRAFLDDAVYDGRVRVEAEDRPRTAQQALLAD